MNKIVVYSNGPQQLIYYPDFFPRSYFEQLERDLPWQQNEIRVFGKLHNEPRLTCWYGPAYKYSSIQWPDAAFSELMHEIKNHLNLAVDFPFNAALANYYRSGEDSMGWHSDNEPEMDRSIIASVTFGGKRLFHFRHKRNGEKLSLELNDRSLLLMIHMQDDWQHAIPKTKRPVAPRINLTFRKIQHI
jgi:alkylated DNA repair dioxygenase AlkB